MNIQSKGSRRARPPSGRPVARGFTLIELMITVAIVALLASIAYPAYLDSVRKGRRAEGRSALLNLLQQQERFYTQTGSYMSFVAGATDANGTIDIAGTVTGGQTIPFKTKSGEGSGSSAYLLSAATCAAGGRSECILLSAVPQGTDTEAGTLTITTAGAKSCTGTKTSVCW